MPRPRRPLTESGELSNTLTASDLTLIRGDRCLFRDLSFAAVSGELVLLEGPNGSGKTSLLRAILGLLDLEHGDIRWNGSPVRDNRQDFHANVAWLAHRIGFKADLNPVDNLRFAATLHGSSCAELDAVLERLQIEKLKRLPLRLLSAGQQRRVALARLPLSGARLWLLDEPFTNLDREGRALVLKLVGEHVAAGGLCIMAAHYDVDIDVPLQRVGLA